MISYFPYRKNPNLEERKGLQQYLCPNILMPNSHEPGIIAATLWSAELWFLRLYVILVVQGVDVDVSGSAAQSCRLNHVAVAPTLPQPQTNTGYV